MADRQILNAGYEERDDAFERAEGNYIHREDGKRFLDLALGAGSLIMGHADPDIVAAVQRQVAAGTIYLQNSAQSHQLAEALADFIPTVLPHYIFCNSGSEATQRAVRYARAATGKAVIASFEGGWHGMNEWTLFENGRDFAIGEGRAFDGIPDIVSQASICLPYNDISALNYLIANADQIAAIIIEPIQGSNPQPQIGTYLHALMSSCREHGILVIFDELISGFRLAPGGAAERMELMPDIACYGKILGGGLPMGMVAISENVHARTFGSADKSMLTGGTFSANPLSCAAGLALLNRLESDAYRRLQKLGDYFRRVVNKALYDEGIPFHCDGVGSITRLYFCREEVKSRADRDAKQISVVQQHVFHQAMKAQAVLWPSNGILCHALTQNETLYDALAVQIVVAAREVMN